MGANVLKWFFSQNKNLHVLSFSSTPVFKLPFFSFCSDRNEEWRPWKVLRCSLGSSHPQINLIQSATHLNFHPSSCILNVPSYFVRRFYNFLRKVWILHKNLSLASRNLELILFLMGRTQRKGGQFHEVKALIVTCTYTFNFLLVDSSKPI